jgi:hypothetical protein
MVGVLVFGGGCSAPAVHDPVALARTRMESIEASERVAREQYKELHRRQLTAQASPRRIARQLLADYGSQLSPFQQSKLLASQYVSYEEGEAQVLEWIELNRRF